MFLCVADAVSDVNANAVDGHVASAKTGPPAVPVKKRSGDTQRMAIKSELNEFLLNRSAAQVTSNMKDGQQQNTVGCIWN